MKKIISLFQRNFEGDRRVRNEVTPGAEWVINGEGVATRKYDGTCCMIRSGVLFKRYEVKKGGTPPAHFEPANDVDENTGKQQGWVPVGDGPEDRWHREACPHPDTWKDGTYELCGPKIQGNPEAFIIHVLVRHDNADKLDAPRDYDGLKSWLSDKPYEGIVFHHPDGRMVKIKKKDFPK